MKNRIYYLLAFFGLAIAIYSLVNPIMGAASLAVVGGMWNEDMTLWRKGISQKMVFVTWDKGFWFPYMGFIGGRKSMFDDNYVFGNVDRFKKPKATGMPIEVFQDFQNVVSSKMQVPVVYPLTGLGVSGTAQLQGKGERPKLAVQEVGINQKRHAYLEQDSKMSKQLLTHIPRLKQLFRRSGDYLGDWFGRYNAYQPYYAFLYGSSENLIDPTNGTGVSRHSHMNIYCASSGKVAFSNTKATYEAAVATALNGINSDNASYYFSAAMIDNMVYEAAHTHQILPLDIEGMSLYPIVISDSQAKQLQADANWKDRMKYAAERNLKSNPLFSGRIAGIYGGALVHIDSRVPSARTNGDADFSTVRSTTGDTTGVCYGTEDANNLPDFMEVQRDAGALKPAILFGQSAVLAGVASDISFETEEYDFKQKIEVGADMIHGFQIADIYDNDGYWGTAGDKRYENRSSLIAFSYSPTSASW